MPAWASSMNTEKQWSVSLLSEKQSPLRCTKHRMKPLCLGIFQPRAVLAIFISIHIRAHSLNSGLCFSCHARSPQRCCSKFSASWVQSKYWLNKPSNESCLWQGWVPGNMEHRMSRTLYSTGPTWAKGIRRKGGGSGALGLPWCPGPAAGSLWPPPGGWAQPVHAHPRESLPWTSLGNETRARWAPLGYPTGCEWSTQWLRAFKKYSTQMEKKNPKNKHGCIIQEVFPNSFCKQSDVNSEGLYFCCSYCISVAPLPLYQENSRE